MGQNLKRIMYNVTKITVIEDNEAVKTAWRSSLEASNAFTLWTPTRTAWMRSKILKNSWSGIDWSWASGHHTASKSNVFCASVHTTILVISVHEDGKLVFEALCAGASGYRPKIPTALTPQRHRRVLGGGAPMSSKIASLVVKSIQRNLNTPLSDRETDVLMLLAKGKPTDQGRLFEDFLSASMQFVLRCSQRESVAEPNDERQVRLLRLHCLQWRR